jgi:hypothetical protein
VAGANIARRLTRRGADESYVAFYVGETAGQLMLLGGNQGIGEVCVKAYPKVRLLGYRRPNGYARLQASL